MKNNKKIKIAINGFGRIGRAAFKIALTKSNLEIVALNDLTDHKTLAWLLQRDTVYGLYPKKVEAIESKPIKSADCQGAIKIGSKVYPVLSQKDPSLLPWKKLGVDVVIESTGFFRTTDLAKSHLKAGAKKVVISAPPKDDVTPTFVDSVNVIDNAQKEITQDIVSDASCTTNCIAPVVSVINNEYGIEKAMMTTIHSYTADQNLVDGPHKDLRRARAAAYNIVPTSTGAAISTTDIIPQLKNKFDGLAIRVPTIVGSLSDITMVLKKDTTVEKVNQLFKKKIKEKRYKNVLDVTQEPLVSSDIVGNPHSSIVDLSFTTVIGGNMLKILSWYDNEWGYANRLVGIINEMKM